MTAVRGRRPRSVAGEGVLLTESSSWARRLLSGVVLTTLLFASPFDDAGEVNDSRVCLLRAESGEMTSSVGGMTGRKAGRFGGSIPAILQSVSLLIIWSCFSSIFFGASLCTLRSWFVLSQSRCGFLREAERARSVSVDFLCEAELLFFDDVLRADCGKTRSDEECHRLDFL